MEKNNWKLILHEQCEDPYFEITNGPISLCCNAGLVGETEDEEDAIFKKVADALNNSGIDFHSENKLELKQHIEILECGYKIEELQARCERYETALNQIREHIKETQNKVNVMGIALIINEALSGEGKEGENDDV